jgi:hypothetical protein
LAGFRPPELLEASDKMADIQATITKLQSSTLKLDQVLEILKQSIRMVGAVNNNIAKLCRFFDAMATLITVMVTQQVRSRCSRSSRTPTRTSSAARTGSSGRSAGRIARSR